MYKEPIQTDHQRQPIQQYMVSAECPVSPGTCGGGEESGEESADGGGRASDPKRGGAKGDSPDKQKVQNSPSDDQASKLSKEPETGDTGAEDSKGERSPPKPLASDGRAFYSQAQSYWVQHPRVMRYRAGASQTAQYYTVGSFGAPLAPSTVPAGPPVPRRPQLPQQINYRNQHRQHQIVDPKDYPIADSSDTDLTDGAGRYRKSAKRPMGVSASRMNARSAGRTPQYAALMSREEAVLSDDSSTDVLLDVEDAEGMEFRATEDQRMRQQAAFLRPAKKSQSMPFSRYRVWNPNQQQPMPISMQRFYRPSGNTVQQRSSVSTAVRPSPRGEATRKTSKETITKDSPAEEAPKKFTLEDMPALADERRGRKWMDPSPKAWASGAPKPAESSTSLRMNERIEKSEEIAKHYQRMFFRTFATTMKPDMEQAVKPRVPASLSQPNVIRSAGDQVRQSLSRTRASESPVPQQRQPTQGPTCAHRQPQGQTQPRFLCKRKGDHDKYRRSGFGRKSSPTLPAGCNKGALNSPKMKAQDFQSDILDGLLQDLLNKGCVQASLLDDTDRNDKRNRMRVVVERLKKISLEEAKNNPFSANQENRSRAEKERDDAISRDGDNDDDADLDKDKEARADRAMNDDDEKNENDDKDRNSDYGRTDLTCEINQYAVEMYKLEEQVNEEFADSPPCSPELIETGTFDPGQTANKTQARKVLADGDGEMLYNAHASCLECSTVVEPEPKTLPPSASGNGLDLRRAEKNIPAVCSRVYVPQPSSVPSNCESIVNGPSTAARCRRSTAMSEKGDNANRVTRKDDLQELKSYFLNLVDRVVSRELGNSKSERVPNARGVGDYPFKETASRASSLTIDRTTVKKNSKSHIAMSPTQLRQLHLIRNDHIRNIQDEARKVEELNRYLDSLHLETAAASCPPD